MPELPEVEVLVRHLAPLLTGKRIRAVEVRRAKVLGRTSASELREQLLGARFRQVSRRGKYIVFELQPPARKGRVLLLGHLGMTGRMYLLPRREALPKHAAMVLDLGSENFVYEDPRYFGRLTLDLRPLEVLGPEPLSEAFTIDALAEALRGSSQPVKVRLMDQGVIAGIGNIYASEALFRAGISHRVAARRLTGVQVWRLWKAIKTVLEQAIQFGSTVPLSFSGGKKARRLFYYGSEVGAGNGSYEERLVVYGRRGQPCLVCGAMIRRCFQAGRSTFFCPSCQKTR